MDDLVWMYVAVLTHLTDIDERQGGHGGGECRVIIW